ncbi:MAG: sugar phosphate isomerase/epimerase family protein [Planctomycetota bacterium]
MRVALSTHGVVYKPLDVRTIERIAAAGFDSIELWGMRPHLDYGEESVLREIVRAVRDTGLRVESWHAPFYSDFESLYAGKRLSLVADAEKERRIAVDEIRRSIDGLTHFGGGIAVIHPGRTNESDSPRKREWLLDGLRKVAAHVVDSPIRLAIENLLSDFSTPDVLCEVVDILARDSIDIGICLDVGHANVTGHLGDKIRMLGHRLITTHLSDNLGDNDSHLVPGEGTIDWPDVLSAISLTGYDGRLVLEPRDESRGEKRVDVLMGRYARGADLIRRSLPARASST